MRFASSDGHVVDEPYSFEPGRGETTAEVFFDVIHLEPSRLEHRSHLRAAFCLAQSLCDKGGLSLPGRGKQSIAGTGGQARLLANRRTRYDLGGNEKFADHFLDHPKLLVVLFAEVGA